MFSEVEIWPVENSNTLKARGRVMVSNAVSVNISVLNGKNGLFVSFPGRWVEKEGGEKKWYSDVFIRDDKVRVDLNKYVLAAYNEKVSASMDQGEAEVVDNQEMDDTIPF